MVMINCCQEHVKGETFLFDSRIINKTIKYIKSMLE